MITYDEERKLYVHTDPAWPRFKELVAGIGWMDPSGDDTAILNWALVIGRGEDDRYFVLDEILGNISTLCDKLTDAKDRFFLQRIFCDRTLPQLIRVIREHDGLCQYGSKGKNVLGQEQWIHGQESWENFRSRSTTAPLIPLVEDLTADMQTAIEMVRELVDTKALLPRSECPSLMRVLRLSLDELIQHPAVKALTYPLIVMEREKLDVEEIEDRLPIYPNLGR